MNYKGGRGVVPPWTLSMSCRRGQVRNRLWYSPDERLPELSAGGGGCPKSQTFLSENRESASGLVSGIGAFRFPLIPDLSLGLGRDGVRNEMQINRDFTLTRFSP